MSYICPDHNHLLTASTDDPTLDGAQAIIKVSGHQYQWLTGGYDLQIGHFRSDQHGGYLVDSGCFAQCQWEVPSPLTHTASCTASNEQSQQLRKPDCVLGMQKLLKRCAVFS